MIIIRVDERNSVLMKLYRYMIYTSLVSILWRKDYFLININDCNNLKGWYYMREIEPFLWMKKISIMNVNKIQELVNHLKDVSLLDNCHEREDPAIIAVISRVGYNKNVESKKSQSDSIYDYAITSFFYPYDISFVKIRDNYGLYYSFINRELKTLEVNIVSGSPEHLAKGFRFTELGIDHLDVEIYDLFTFFNNLHRDLIFPSSIMPSMYKEHDFKIKSDIDYPIIIFRGLTLFTIVNLAKHWGFTLSGGSISNRMRLSPIQFNLSSFIFLLESYEANTKINYSYKSNIISKYLNIDELYSIIVLSNKDDKFKNYLYINYVLSRLNLLVVVNKQIQLINTEDLEEKELNFFYMCILPRLQKEILIWGHIIDRFHAASEDSRYNLRELKKKESFNNIKVNKRFYSTKIEYNKDSLNLNNELNSVGLNEYSFISHSPVYTKLTNLLLKVNSSSLFTHKNIKSQVQLEIENLLFDDSSILFNGKLDKKLSLNYTMLNSGFLNHISNSIKDLESLIENQKLNVLNIENKIVDNDFLINDFNGILDVNTRHKILFVIYNKVSMDTLIGYLLGLLFNLISKNSWNNSTNYATDEYLKLGRKVINHYLYLLYQDDVKLIKDINITFSVWNNNLSSKTEFFKRDDVALWLGSQLMYILEQTKLITSDVKLEKNFKRRVYILPYLINNKIEENKLKYINLTVSNKLPMICEPKNYEISNNKIKLGGYLLNDVKYTIPMIIPNPELGYSSTIKEENIVYSMVNNISKVGFKINNQVLDFILEKYKEFNLILDPNYIHPLSLKSNLNYTEKKILETYNSSIFIEYNIIKIAIMFRDISEFFIPVRLDNRGRLYCYTDYLTYQSTELSKALLLFSKKVKIQKTNIKALEYLKIFGANCFGNGLNKKSNREKLEWINLHESNILEFKNGYLIQKAEYKLLFIAFCFEYNNIQNYFKSDSDFYMSDFPVQLDAGCNGYQHLALLLGDNELSKNLNLKSSNSKDIPEDFYSYIAINLKFFFKQKLEDIQIGKGNRLFKDNYERLYNLDIHRSLIKKPIMTKPYNVTFLVMADYIMSEFDIDENYLEDLYKKKENGRKDVWYNHKKDPRIKLNEKDIYLLTYSIHFIIYHKYPKLKMITDYFSNIAKLCNNLNLSIPWVLPSGLSINQKYINYNILKIKPFTYSKKTFNLRIPDFHKLNYRKQIRALMPNLIHSLDASSLALLIDGLFKQNKIFNFYSIHDCFAVPADSVDNLIKELQLVYLTIYSKEDYLQMFDKGIKDHILLHLGENNFDVITNKINCKGEIFNYPNLNLILNSRDFNYEELTKANYIIN